MGFAVAYFVSYFPPALELNIALVEQVALIGIVDSFKGAEEGAFQLLQLIKGKVCFMVEVNGAAYSSGHSVFIMACSFRHIAEDRRRGRSLCNGKFILNPELQYYGNCYSTWDEDKTIGKVKK